MHLNKSAVSCSPQSSWSLILSTKNVFLTVDQKRSGISNPIGDYLRHRTVSLHSCKLHSRNDLKLASIKANGRIFRVPELCA